MTGRSPHAEILDRARQLADAGRHAEALDVLRAYLALEPDDGEALNDAGALLYAAGRFDEAADFLRRAAARLPENPGQALWNLAEVSLAAGRPADVLPLFDGLQRCGVLTADLANRTGGALLERGDLAGGLEAVIRSLRIAPGQNGLLPVYERVRGLRPRVAFFCENEDTKFINDIYAFINARFEARFSSTRDQAEMFRLLQWCDIAWMEWCTPQAVAASQMPKVCRIIVRLHRYEAFRPWPGQVAWENIDALVAVGNQAVVDRLKSGIPNLDRRTRIVMIPNGVDLDRFPFRDRPRGKNLACLGYINLRKNPGLLLQAFQRLHAADPEFRLFFAGGFQDDGLLEDYVRCLVDELGLAHAVHFDPWQNDPSAWLEDKHYLVAASIGEGHPVGAIEGMARGLKPVIHAFPGSRGIFPQEYLWRTVDEFADRILREPYRPQEYRDFVAEHYPLRLQLDRVHALFLEFEKNPVRKPAAVVSPAPLESTASLAESAPAVSGTETSDANLAATAAAAVEAASLDGADSASLVGLAAGSEDAAPGPPVRVAI
jgi:glycosyltransferase involved in cell wall biosynthesis